MAANRKPVIADLSLLAISKTTLVDLVWRLAQTNGECSGCDDDAEVLRVIVANMKAVEAPSADFRRLSVRLERELRIQKQRDDESKADEEAYQANARYGSE